MNHSELLPELSGRWVRCRELLAKFSPQAEGLLVFSRLNIYYLSGSFASGVFFLPLEGDPVLFCRRGAERARIESPVRDILSFNSYAEIKAALAGLGCPLPQTLAAEMNGLSWALSNSLSKHLAGQRFIPGDRILGMARAKKSNLERSILREAGIRHARCMTELLPPLLHEGMTEAEISHRILEIFFAEGHHGMIRMENYGEEVFLGHIAIGESANYPSVFNGPVGLRGIHPATPHMGSPDVHWQRNRPLTIDNGFTLNGYMTDKTQVYWIGDAIPDPIRRAQDFAIAMQSEIADQLKPGSIPSGIWKRCLAKAEASQWAEGFMGLGGNKVRFVGHGIGLAVDEYPVLAEGFDLPLEEGMVLAIEPKIGIPGVGMVGVENTFEVTEKGGVCLTGKHFDFIMLEG